MTHNSQDSASLPNLDRRFLAPKNWRWHSFKNKQGRKIRFGSAFPDSRLSSAVVVILCGRAEFIEKYFEVARDLLDKNLSVWVMDWQGQGGSHRIGKNPQQPASVPFEQHVEDLHQFIMDYVKHSCVHPDVGRIPMVMLAQSMGGNIGLRFLHKYPGMFEGALLGAPMLGLKAVEAWPIPLAQMISGVLGCLFDRFYAFGQKNWNPAERQMNQAYFSHDPIRASIHDLWYKHNPALQLGGATFGWLRRALDSCAILHRPDILRSIDTHCVLAVSGQEKLVSNQAIYRAATFLPHATVLDLPQAGHETLMEQDIIRDQFMSALFALIKKRVIERPESLKPF